MIYNNTALAEYQKSMDTVITFLEGLDFSHEDRKTRDFHAKTLQGLKGISSGFKQVMKSTRHQRSDELDKAILRNKEMYTTLYNSLVLDTVEQQSSMDAVMLHFYDTTQKLLAS